MSLEEWREAHERRWSNAEQNAQRALEIAERLLPKGSPDAQATLAAAVLSEVSSDYLVDGLSGIQSAIEM